MSLLRPTMLLNIAAKTASIRAAPIMATRFYTVSASDAQTRVLDVVKGFEKVDPSKVTVDSVFVKDLGLDSLDAVEVVMAIEEEFSIEIPDKDADEIKSVKQAIDYITKHSDAQ
ncbi:NADH dehydrogenase 1, alpha/beta subcomplex subunit 1 NDUFAB1/ACP [Mucor lusitanicus]|uniref:Acyl carrier protein n=2 Tax=Mucor circinelloides f. lusitanicus TaxID=29924 RepID=A0A168LKY9_MUCCL|nr:NADH dehydrogenase 1, alpha/beta subcomplex subunit 1 NDUFAB1/ACP [Mucor lusitanicus]OAD03658.1 NADH dehydrogenase 1, alpha/beta subcomplex subunit 1 NDUFAB1/ACP [Mucor lusitanicus CBS 277.49]